jgi:putative N6-adenine-specific DNA methylase
MNTITQIKNPSELILSQLSHLSQLSQDDLSLTVITPRMMAPLVEEEIKELQSLWDLPIVEDSWVVLPGSVSFKADFKTMIILNYCLRIGSRVLLNFYSGPIKHLNDVYVKASAIPWDKILGVDQTFALESTIHNPLSYSLNNSMMVSLKIKDGLVDVMRKKFQRRPSVDKRAPQVKITCKIHQDTMQLSLDTTGESLSNRGYRVKGHVAPLRENTASGLLRLMGFKKDSIQPLIDPMGGTGTISIEAALIMKNAFPSTNRSHFLYENFIFAQDWGSQSTHVSQGLQQLKENLRKEILRQECPKNKTSADLRQKKLIIYNDSHPQARAHAMENAQVAGVDDMIEFQHQDVRRVLSPYKEGIVFLNPPYGSRLYAQDTLSEEQQKLVEFYSQLGDWSKRNLTHHHVWVLSENKEALKRFGLKPKRKLPVDNGGLACAFHEFPIN